MKKIKNLTTCVVLSALGLGQTSSIHAQGVIEQPSAIMWASTWISEGQSVTFPGGELNTLSLSCFSHFHSTGVPATISFYEGEGYNGPLLYQQPVMLPGLSTFYPESMLDTLTETQFQNLWYDIQARTESGDLTFDSLATAFNINQVFPPGIMTIVIEIDTTFVDFGHHAIACFTNCYEAGYCFPPHPPLTNNLYSGGIFYFGPILGAIFPGADMAFRITYATTTGTEEQSSLDAKPEVYPNPGVESWNLILKGQKTLVQIFDKEQRLVFSQLLDRGPHEIGNKLPGGIYFLKTNQDVVKLVKL